MKKKMNIVSCSEKEQCEVHKLITFSPQNFYSIKSF